ncbi:hypothetical protein M413DRAFT_445657 [Hebeloma cylindrosporum]|uniref:Phosphatidylglycerol/phosphatidylinositol transfer protein n=1 Tax=Hebeloma cylindrosporum TaxID=76867 RepID=A0A0C3BW82_HEBCY|nr:hypothetical protein M413DRAFT_445657 [Hebeloma cylindrosporum h7]
MKLLKLLTTAICILGVAAQRSFIEAPVAGAKVSAGKQFIVQLVRPNSLQGSTEVGLVIGLVSCTSDPTGACPPTSSQLGTILFNGDYNPQLHEQPGRPYQNFTLTVPAQFTRGKAQVATARFHLIGAGPSPVLELNNVIITVA